MIVADLLRRDQGDYPFQDKIAKSDLIALDGKDGKVLFDTRKNKKEYIEKFMSGKVLNLWADAVKSNNTAYRHLFVPVLKCYVSHDSWKKGAEK